MGDGYPVILPPPRDWQDFEDFCHELFSAEWGDPAAQKYGRPGQKQHGVDIFGQHGDAWVAVQCKAKGVDKELTDAQIEHEVDQAKHFDQSLSELTIATTAPPNTRMADAANRLTAAGALGDGARVRVLGWGELVELLTKHRELFRRWAGRLLGDPVEAVSASWDPRASRIFAGREGELERLAEWLTGSESDGTIASIGAVEGLPGVGKSYLADRFFHEHRDTFPGGYARVVLDPRALTTVDVLVEDLANTLELAPGPKTLDRVRQRLADRRTLVHVENLDSADAERLAADFLAKLPGVFAIVTGRRGDLGDGSGWRRLTLQPFDDDQGATSRQLLRQELDEQWRDDQADEIDHLAEALGHLPLALHLASGYLRRGLSVERFLDRLAAEQHTTRPLSRGEDERRVLARTFEISLDLLRSTLGEDAESLFAGLRALGHAPRTGFGASLGATLAGLDLEAFENLMIEATGLHLVERMPSSERAGAWKMHALLADWLADAEERPTVIERMSGWFLERLDDSEEGRAARWREAQVEIQALTSWLWLIPNTKKPELAKAAYWFARSNGPLDLWFTWANEVLTKCTLSEFEKSDVLWLKFHCAWRSGRIDEAFQTAVEKADLDVHRGAEREAALAFGAVADIHQHKGELAEAVHVRRKKQLPALEQVGDIREMALARGRIADALALQGKPQQALRIRLEEVVPVFEQLGDARERAVALGKAADLHLSLGGLDEALRIREEEEIPVYRRLGDSRELAVALGKVALVHKIRGDLDLALQIHQDEELPVYEQVGDVHSAALAKGRIADIYEAQGDLNEALRIRQEEELPIMSRLGDIRSVAIVRVKIANVRLARGELNEALRTYREEVLPVVDRLGDPRLRAVVMGKIAKALQERGEVEEALRIREEEEAPALERLGDVRELLISRANIALLLLELDRSGDKGRASSLLRLAHKTAESLGIPEAEQIAAIIARTDG